MPLGDGAVAAIAGGSGVIGSGISAIANHYENKLAFERQKQLNKQNYIDYVDAAKAAGATPAAIAQGLVGGGAGSMPTTSTSNNPVPDFGASMASGVSAAANLKQSAAAQDNANAALTNAETERMLGLMKLKFEPAKYFADIRKSLAQAFESTKNAFLHGSMKQYYDELTKDMQQVSPWKLAGLRQSLLNDMATFNKILQETRTSKAQEGYFKAGAYELGTRSDMNKSQTEKNYAEAWNEHLRGFRIQWENTLLSYGIDPNKPFWENTARLMYTEPDLFKKRMDMFVSSLNTLDGRIQENLGEHYKRNAALGYGLYKLNQIHQKNANARAYRFGVLGNTISSFIPFAGGSMPSPVSDTELPWYMDDGRF